MRHLLPNRKAPDNTRNHIQTAALTELVATGEQQLVAKADAQKGARTIDRSSHRVQQTTLLEGIHHSVECTITREDHRISLIDNTWVIRDNGRNAHTFGE